MQKQSEQYALTIAALEEKLLKSMDKCNSLHTDNVGLFEELKMKTTICEEDLKSMCCIIVILLYSVNP